jgi:hypothetical protein
MSRIRRRFRIEMALTIASAVLLVLTAAVPDWIEVLTGVEPDGGDGSLERGLVALLVASTVLFGVLARIEWRRARNRRQPSSG